MKCAQNKIMALYLILPMILAIFAGCIHPSCGYSNLTVETSMTVSTDSQFILRQTVQVTGTATIDGSPATDMLVAMEIVDPAGPIENPLVYRTIPIGDPNETWAMEIVGMNIYSGDWTPLDTVKIGNSYYFGATVRNPLGIDRENVVVVLTILDGNQIPVRAFQAFEGSIGAHDSITTHQTIPIPSWAYSGDAYIHCSVYDKLPSESGVPYAPEKSAKFHISRTQEGLYGELPLPTETHDSSTGTGTYESAFRFSPEPEPGTYRVHVTGRYSAMHKAISSTTFDVLDRESPPQASFTYSPLEPYPNQTATFDASSSTAEGYGDVIISYEWDFGDGSDPVVSSEPTATHEFMEVRQYIVTLNVTDAEGYWSTTQKPINTKPTDPVAAFTWYPLTPRLNITVTFNATDSLPGWSTSQGAPAQIVQYTWNFGDSPTNFPVDQPTIQHKYDEPGNMTVTLTVTDSIDQQDTISHLVEVENRTTPPYDINGDGKVDIKDLAIVAKAYGSYPGYPNWNPDADITGPEGVPDGKVDIRDIALVAHHYGEIM